MNSCRPSRHVLHRLLSQINWRCEHALSRRHISLSAWRAQDQHQHSQKRFLSPAYECVTEWEQRLQSPLIKKIEIEDFFHQIDKKFQSEKVISAIDVDLFVNKVTEEADLEDVEELAFRLRKSPSAAKTLPSTSHAIIRTFLALNRTDDLMRMLDDRINYGLFLDSYTANLLMDAFLKEENYRDATKVACLLMLQEDFEPSSTKFFALLSCLKYLEDPKPTPWDSFEVEVVVEEKTADKPRKKKQEEEKIRVQVQRNLYYDDHFDISNPQNLIGKTLSLISMHLNEDKLVKRSIEILGWALFDKWNKVESCLNQLKKDNQAIASSVIGKLAELVGARQAEIEASPDQKPPRPKMHHFPGSNLDPEEIDKLFDTQLKWDDFFSSLPNVKTLLKDGKVATSDVNLISKTEEYLSKAIESGAQNEIEQQKKNYEYWEQRRQSELQKQVERIRDIQTLLDIQAKKKELSEKEEVIFFFDNEEEWMMRQPGPPAEPEKKKRASYGFPSKETTAPSKIVIEEDYVPPEIHTFAHSNTLDEKPENPRKVRQREKQKEHEEQLRKQKG